MAICVSKQKRSNEFLRLSLPPPSAFTECANFCFVESNLFAFFLLLNFLSNTFSPMTSPCQVFSPRYFTCGDSQHQRRFLKGRNGIPPGISAGAKNCWLVDSSPWVLFLLFFFVLSLMCLEEKRKNEALSGQVSDWSLRKLRHQREEVSFVEWRSVQYNTSASRARLSFHARF